MYPKTALKILLAVVFILIIVFASFWFYSNKSAPTGGLTEESQREIEAAKVEDIVNKKKQGEELDTGEQEVLDVYVEEQVEERREEIDKKSDEEIKEQGYTQNEINFILNPKGTVEEELGIIEEEKEDKSLTQEEIDAILNP